MRDNFSQQCWKIKVLSLYWEKVSQIPGAIETQSILLQDTLSLTFSFWLTYCWHPFLSVFVSFAKFQPIGLPDPIPTEPCSTPMLFPGHLYLLPLSVHLLFAPYFDQQVRNQPCQSYLPCWISQAWEWRALVLYGKSLKICQLCSALLNSHLSPRAVSWRVLLTNSLKSWSLIS